jgi:hypothetical protein
MSMGTWSSASLMASGLAIAVMPRRVEPVLDVHATSARGVAETRAGLGGTFAALGGWALLRRTSDSYTAVGVTWLGAAALRLIALRQDNPKTDTTYWAFFAAELTLGAAGVLASGSKR